jgi:hypothetical protein
MRTMIDLDSILFLNWEVFHVFFVKKLKLHIFFLDINDSLNSSLKIPSKYSRTRQNPEEQNCIIRFEALVDDSERRKSKL